MREEYIRQCTLEVIGIPTNISPNYLEGILKEQIEAYSTGNIIGVYVVPDLGDVEDVFKESIYLKNYTYGDQSYLIQSQQYYLGKKKLLKSRIEKIKAGALEKNAGYAFVLCRAPMIATHIINSFEAKESLGIGMNYWKIQEAGYYSDIIWRSPPETQVLSTLKKIFWNGLFFAIFLLVLTPLTLVKMISELLKKAYVPTKIISFAAYSLPSFTISLFLSIIVPLSIKFLINLERSHMYSKVILSAFSKYMLYSIGITILFPLLGAVTLDSVIEKLSEIEISKWNLSLVTNIVLVGEFFLNFTVSMAIGSNVLDLVLTNEYFTNDFYIYRKSFEEMTAPVFDIPYEYCKVLTILGVVLVYCVSMPLILPFGCLFMFLKYWIDKYHLLYVYRIESFSDNTLNGVVLVFLVFLTGISQLVNSGLFMASGIAILVWLGGFLATTGLTTIVIAVLICKYWNTYHTYIDFEPSVKNLYKHPFTTWLNS
jgi:Calcium-dependent channel, 7TM region, putative phosphate